MKAQIDTVQIGTVQIETYSLRGLDHETMRILDRACAALLGTIEEGRNKSIDREKLDTISQLIIDITSGEYESEVNDQSKHRFIFYGSQVTDD